MLDNLLFKPVKVASVEVRGSVPYGGGFHASLALRKRVHHVYNFALDRIEHHGSGDNVPVGYHGGTGRV